eukprot:scaffold1407_cov379-Pavlova_lutheri.AAC.8
MVDPRDRHPSHGLVARQPSSSFTTRAAMATGNVEPSVRLVDARRGEERHGVGPFLPVKTSTCVRRRLQIEPRTNGTTKRVDDRPVKPSSWSSHPCERAKLPPTFLCRSVEHNNGGWREVIEAQHRGGAVMDLRSCRRGNAPLHPSEWVGRGGNHLREHMHLIHWQRVCNARSLRRRVRDT